MTLACEQLNTRPAANSSLAPPGYREACLALFSVCVLLVLGGILLFYRMRRKSGRLAKRSFSLLLVSGLATILSASVVLLREYLGREEVVCTFVLAAHYIIPPLAIGPLTVKVNVHAFRLRKSYVKAGLSYNGVRKEQDRIERDERTARHRFGESFASFLLLKSKTRSKPQQQQENSRRMTLPFKSSAVAVINELDEDEANVRDDGMGSENEAGLAGEGRKSSKPQQQQLLAGEPTSRSFKKRSSTTTRRLERPSSYLALPWGANAHDTEAEIPLKDLVRNESALFSLVMVVLLCLPYIVAIVGRAVTDGKYSLPAPCLGCDFEFMDVYILLGLTFLLCSLFLVSTLRVWNSPDPLYVLWECKLCVCVFLLFGIPQAVLYIVDPQGLEAGYQFTWLMLETVWCMVLFGIQSYAQVLATWCINRDMKNEPISLFRLLENVELRDMFDEHLASEFSIENLRFWDRAIYWKSIYAQTLPEESQRRARDLYRVFIQRDAAMPLNLSGPNAKALHLAFQSSSSTSPVPSTVFDAALVECFKLMNDGLSRFVRGDKFKAFAKTSALDFEGDVLRNTELGLEIQAVSIETYLRQFDDLGRNSAAPSPQHSAKRSMSFGPTTSTSSPTHRAMTGGNTSRFPDSPHSSSLAAATAAFSAPQSRSVSFVDAPPSATSYNTMGAPSSNPSPPSSSPASRSGSFAMLAGGGGLDEQELEDDISLRDLRSRPISIKMRQSYSSTPSSSAAMIEGGAATTTTQSNAKSPPATPRRSVGAHVSFA